MFLDLAAPVTDEDVKKAKIGARFFRDITIMEEDLSRHPLTYDMQLECAIMNARYLNCFVFKVEQREVHFEENIHFNIYQRFRIHFIKMGEPKIIKFNPCKNPNHPACRGFNFCQQAKKK